MTTVLFIVAILYLVGCFAAYRVVMADAEPETQWLLPTLGSWVTVLRSWMPVQ